jgi:hypothetical protein
VIRRAQSRDRFRLIPYDTVALAGILAVPADPYFANVTLLLHCNGTNGSTTFTDVKGHTVTPIGNAQISTAQSKFGGASGLFDGSGDYISVTDAADISMGSSDFTIEGWAYFAAGASPNCIYDKRATFTARGLAIFRDTDNNLYFAAGNSDTAAWEVFLSGAAPTGAWLHYAFVRSGSAWYAFVNGTQVGTTTASFAVDDGGVNLFFGILRDTISYPLNGNLDDIRITKGVARYTANFTPPSAQFPDT